MSKVTNTDHVVTESKLTEFYENIKPFLGCPAYLTSEGNAEYYSTEEKVIGRWTDGKPLYKKVIYFSPQITITANSWQNIKSDETDIECIVDAIILRNDGVFIPQYGSISPSIGTRGLWVYTTQLQNTIQGIILKYTKISDSAATTIQSDPNEYSTEERIVGKWIDGKPLYQKTITGTIDRNKTILNITNMNIVGISQFRAAYSRGYVFDSRTVNDLDFYTEDDTFLIINDNGGEFINREFIITIQYTKTTD